jgi:S1-C subfamily serine protease
MKTLLTLLFLIGAVLTQSASAVDKKIVDKLQAISVTVETTKGSGSGVIKVKKRGDDSINFVFTAAHVVSSLRSTKDIIDGKTGTKRTVVSFKDAKVVQVTVEDGRTIGKVELFAQVFKYSQEEDLAILKIRKKNFSTESVEFYLDKDIPAIGTELVHVGSFLGEKAGSNSLSVGVVSQLGRLIEDEEESTKIFDQTTVTAFPGSSGGGVFLKSDGKLIGFLLRGTSETFNFISPVRRVLAWAKQSGLEWLVRDDLPLPSEAVLSKIPVEDNGVSFDALKAAAAIIKGGHSETSKETHTLELQK